MKTTEEYPFDFALLDEIESLPVEVEGYTLLELISSGRAVVFRARQKHPSREVVLKIPRAGFGKAHLERFRTEYALAASLRHSAIVPILEVGELMGHPFYSMPYIEGHTLLDFLAHHPLDVRQRQRLFERICEVVAVLHREGLIHRDLKSQNIMIDRYGEVALLDFGLAVNLSEISEAGRFQRIEGTIRTMSPEQAAGASVASLGAESDVFALGVIGFRMMTETFPFALPEAKTLALETVAACKVDFAPLERCAASPRLKQTLTQALARAPEQRFANAGEMLEALRPEAKGATGFGWRLRKRRFRVSSFRLLLVATGIGLLFWGIASLWE